MSFFKIVFIGLFILSSVNIAAQEINCPDFFKNFEEGNYRAAKKSFLECIDDFLIAKESISEFIVNDEKMDREAEEYVFYIQLLNLLLDDYDNVDSDLFEVMLRDSVIKDKKTLSLAYFRLSSYYSFHSINNKAVEMNQRALELAENVYDKNSYEYNIIIGSLSKKYADLGDFKKAIELGNIALSIAEEIYEENDPTYATVLSLLGTLYSYTGDYTKAIELISQSLTILEDKKTLYNTEYALNLNNLAKVYNELENFEKSIGMLEQAIDVQMGSFNKNWENYAI